MKPKLNEDDCLETVDIGTDGTDLIIFTIVMVVVFTFFLTVVFTE